MATWKPEEKTEIQIVDWLSVHGYEVYLNRRGSLAEVLKCNVFTVEGTKRKPDLILKSNLCYFAIELKTGIGSKKTRDSRKIIQYYQEIKSGIVKYFINEEEIKPKYFLVASSYSKGGHLFDDEQIRHRINENQARIQGRPMQEYTETFSFVRQLWDEWKTEKDIRFSLGVLLSDKLNGGLGKPAVFVQKFNRRKGAWLPPHNFTLLGHIYD